MNTRWRKQTLDAVTHARLKAAAERNSALHALLATLVLDLDDELSVSTILDAELIMKEIDSNLENMWLLVPDA